MVDIHAHILPGMDDGPCDEQEAVALCAMAAGDGTTHVVATPHTLCYGWNPASDEIRAACGRLAAVLAARGIALEISCAAEARLIEDLPDRVRRGEVLTLDPGGRYLLLELPRDGDLGDALCRVVFELQLGGVTPVIAHPELADTFSRDPGLARTLVDRGAVLQATADCVVQSLAARTRPLADWLAEGLIGVVASDAHDAVTRPPLLSPARDALRESLGNETADLLVAVNPGRILHGEDCLAPPRRQPARKGLLSAVRRRFQGRANPAARRPRP